LLDGESAFAKTDTVSNISINSLLESELEARFIEALRRSKHEEQSFQLKPDVVNGKPGWRLSAAEQTWMIEPQVELGPNDNVMIPVRADFVFHPERSSQALPIAIFTDGFIFHAEGENHRVGYDMAQRMALRRSGRFSIWSLTWDDVEDRFERASASAFENFLNHSPAKLGQLLAAQGLNSMLGCTRPGISISLSGFWRSQTMKPGQITLRSTRLLCHPRQWFLNRLQLISGPQS